MAQNTPNQLTTNQALAALEENLRRANNQALAALERNLHRAKRQRLDVQSLEAQLKMLSARRRLGAKCGTFYQSVR